MCDLGRFDHGAEIGERGKSKEKSALDKDCSLDREKIVDESVHIQRQDVMCLRDDIQGFLSVMKVH